MPRSSAPSRNPLTSQSSGRLYFFIIAVAVTLSFYNSLRVPFLLDDEISILDNESIRKVSSALWPRDEVFTAGRPLLNLSFAVNHALSGTAVAGYHVTNLLIHVLAALFLFAVIRRTLLLPSFRPRFGSHAAAIALGAALVWALNPVQTVSVTYVSQRAESLMGLCYLLTLYGFLRAAESSRRAWAAVAIASCFAGMFVKEVMVTAPIIVLLFDRTFLASSFREVWRRRRALHLGLAASWVALAALILASKIQARGIGYGFDYSWTQYLRIECSAVLHYLRLATWPFPLVFDYGYEVGLPAAPVVAASIAVLSLIGIGLVVAWRRFPAITFLGCWFFVILGPTSSIVPVAGQPIAENRVYLSLAAVAILAAVLLDRILSTRGHAALLAAAAAFGCMSIARNHDFRSEQSIWSDTIAKRPNSSRAHFYYGTALVRRGQMNEGIAHLEKAVALKPSYSFAHVNLATALFGQNRLDDALRHFALAVQLKPDDPAARSNFGSALFKAGKKAEAVEQYREALRLRPTHADARVNLGIVLAHLGKTDEAIATFQEAIRLHPDNAAAREQLALLLASLQPPSRTRP